MSILTYEEYLAKAAEISAQNNFRNTRCCYNCKHYFNEHCHNQEYEIVMHVAADLLCDHWEVK